MLNINKNITKSITFFVFLSFLLLPVIVGASVLNQLDAVMGNTSAYEGGVSEESLAIAIGKIINVILGFLGIIFIVLIIYGGFMWMTAQGNEAQVEKAKKILIRSIVGVIIILISYIITWFVMGTLFELVDNL
jgi:hypothetical protein